MDTYILLYLKQITNKELLYGTWTSAQWVAAWRGGAFRGEWTHVYVGLSLLRCSPETVTTLLFSYALIQNKKLNKRDRYRS